MISFKRKFTPEAAVLLKKLPPQAKPAIRRLTDKLLENPLLGKALQRDLSGYYSIRHSRYRIIYSFQEARHLVIIEYVGLRKDVYEIFERLIQKKP